MRLAERIRSRLLNKCSQVMTDPWVVSTKLTSHMHGCIYIAMQKKQQTSICESQAIPPLCIILRFIPTCLSIFCSDTLGHFLFSIFLALVAFISSGSTGNGWEKELQQVSQVGTLTHNDPVKD